MIEGNTPAEMMLAKAARDLAQILYELNRLAKKVAQVRERADAVEPQEPDTPLASMTRDLAQMEFELRRMADGIRDLLERPQGEPE